MLIVLALELGRTGPTTSLSLLIPANDGPSSFVKIVEDHFRDRFCAGDRARNLDATGEDETQHEGVDTTGDPPADSLDHGAKMGISRPNEHRSLPLPFYARSCLRSIMSATSAKAEETAADAPSGAGGSRNRSRTILLEGLGDH
jgi:hypothetical protein